jgi:hypothetical protein
MNQGGRMKHVSLILLMVALISLAGNPVRAQMGMPTQPIPLLQSSQRLPFQGPNPSLHSLDHCLYNWKIRDTCGDDVAPCYYDENFGQWVGNCNGSLDTPGFSITVPNQIRK